MGDLGAGRGGDQRGDTGVTEQVQHLDRAILAACGLLDARLHPVPVDDLLGKHADMPEGGEAAEEIDAEQGQRPGLAERFLGETPAAHAFLVRIAGEDRVGPVPDMVGKRRAPQRLRFRPDDAVRPVLLELQCVAAVDQVKVAGTGRFQDHRHAFGRPLALARHERAGFGLGYCCRRRGLLLALVRLLGGLRSRVAGGGLGAR